MKTISTKYIGPSNTKGSRIRATDGDNSVIISYRADLKSEEAHMEAARALMTKLNWKGEMMGGHTKDGMVFVFIDEEYIIKGVE